MAFTLSDKQRVINTPSSVRIFNASNVELTTEAGITSALLTPATAGKILIDGFGHFDTSAITDIQLRRGRVAVNESLDFTAVAPANVAIGDVIEAKVEMDTNRYQSTLFVQDKLGGAKPFVFTTAPLTAITPAAIATAISDAYAAAIAKFTKGEYPVILSNPSSGVVRTVTAAGFESVTVRKFSIRRSNQGIGTQPFYKLAIATTNAIGFEGENLGKFLEESIRMNTPWTANVYGVDTADTRVDIRATYTALYLEVSAPFTENLSTLAADHGPLAATHRFVLFLNEATCLGADGAIGKLAKFAQVAGTAGTAGMTIAGGVALGTLPGERTEVLFLANGVSTTTAALFRA